MKKTLLLFCAATALLLASCAKKTSNASYDVIPLPQSIEQQAGESFVLNSSTKIVYPAGNEDLQRVANFLADYIKFSSGKTLAVSDQEPGDNCIVLSLGLAHDNLEAYSFAVNDKQIEIKGVSPSGVFYGTQTLRKAIPVDQFGKDVAFAPVTIEDYPRFGYRGMHLDVCRHFFPIEFVKEYIDMLALHNMNRFHWHISDDQGWRIEIKKYPLLTEKGSVRKETVIGHNTGKFDGTPHGGFFTQEEAREIVKYAADRFITVIPEIDMPGHMLAALHAYPHLGCTGGPYEVCGEWGVFDDVLCAGNDSIYTFLDDVFTEIMEVFPSQYIHIGGDECPKTRWEKCPKCQARIKSLGLKADKQHSAEERLQSYVVTHVVDFLNKHGRKAIGWDEILEGGLVSDATVMSWRGMEGAAAAAKQGNDAIMTPSSHLYFDYYQTLNTKDVPEAIGGYVPLEKVYSFDPIPQGLTEEEARHIIGVQANLWVEYIPNTQQVEYMVLPRMDALSEVQWCRPERRDYDSFKKRLPEMLKLYDKKGYNYSKSAFDIVSSVSSNTETGMISLSFQTIDGAPIYYTLDGTTPDKNSLRYTEPLSISESSVVKAIAIRPGFSSPVYTQTFNINKATMKPIRLGQQPNKGYTYKGAVTLVDGISGSEGSYKDECWLGFNAGVVDIYIDLQQPTEISSVEVGTYVHVNDWIFGATGMEVAVSTDGTNYTSVAKESYPVDTEYVHAIVPHKLSFEKVTASQLKVILNRVDIIPAWHGGAGYPGFLFVDEVKVD